MPPRSPRRDDGRREGSNATAPTRRRVLGALGIGVLTGVGGCVGGVLGRSSADAGHTIRGSVTVRIGGRPTTLQYGIPAATYRTARDESAAVPDAAGAARTAEFLDGLADRLLERAGSPAAGVRAAQSLTASLPYATDAASTGEREYIRHPAETLVDGEGDCDDKAVLLSALLSRPAFGCRTGLVMPHGHCATLVARADLTAGLVADAPLSVTLDGTEFVYVEAVERVSPGDWAKGYGERPILAAYRDRWHLVDGGAVLDAALTALDSGRSGVVTRYV